MVTVNQRLSEESGSIIDYFINRAHRTFYLLVKFNSKKDHSSGKKLHLKPEAFTHYQLFFNQFIFS